MGGVGSFLAVQRHLLTVSIGAAAAGFGPLAAAQPAESTTVSLEFAGAPGCNDRIALLQEIRRRAPGVSFVESGEEVSIQVRVANGVGRVDSALVIDRPPSPRVLRVVSGADCGEVLAATALIVAVAVTPSAPTHAPIPEPPLVDGSRQPDSGPPPLPPAPGPRPDWQLGGGLAGVAAVGLAPGAFPGIEPFLQATTHRNGWSPAFRLGMRQTWRGGISVDGDTATFRLTAATASACPAAWVPTPALVARPCVTASAGSLEATVVRAENRPWVAVGWGLRVETRLHRVLSLDLAASTEIAAVESRFYFDEASFHQTAPVTGWGSIGLAVHL